MSSRPKSAALSAASAVSLQPSVTLIAPPTSPQISQAQPLPLDPRVQIGMYCPATPNMIQQEFQDQYADVIIDASDARSDSKSQDSWGSTNNVDHEFDAILLNDAEYYSTTQPPMTNINAAKHSKPKTTIPNPQLSQPMQLAIPQNHHQPSQFSTYIINDSSPQPLIPHHKSVAKIPYHTPHDDTGPQTPRPPLKTKQINPQLTRSVPPKSLYLGSPAKRASLPTAHYDLDPTMLSPRPTSPIPYFSNHRPSTVNNDPPSVIIPPYQPQQLYNLPVRLYSTKAQNAQQVYFNTSSITHQNQPSSPALSSATFRQSHPSVPPPPPPSIAGVQVLQGPVSKEGNASSPAVLPSDSNLANTTIFDITGFDTLSMMSGYSLTMPQGPQAPPPTVAGLEFSPYSDHFDTFSFTGSITDANLPRVPMNSPATSSASYYPHVPPMNSHSGNGQVLYGFIPVPKAYGHGQVMTTNSAVRAPTSVTFNNIHTITGKIIQKPSRDNLPHLSVTEPISPRSNTTADDDFDIPPTQRIASPPPTIASFKTRQEQIQKYLHLVSINGNNNPATGTKVGSATFVINVNAVSNRSNDLSPTSRCLSKPFLNDLNNISVPHQLLTGSAETTSNPSNSEPAPIPNCKDDLLNSADWRQAEGPLLNLDDESDFDPSSPPINTIAFNDIMSGVFSNNEQHFPHAPVPSLAGTNNTVFHQRVDDAVFQPTKNFNYTIVLPSLPPQSSITPQPAILLDPYHVIKSPLSKPTTAPARSERKKSAPAQRIPYNPKIESNVIFNTDSMGLIAISAVSPQSSVAGNPHNPDAFRLAPVTPANSAVSNASWLNPERQLRPSAMRGNINHAEQFTSGEHLILPQRLHEIGPGQFVPQAGVYYRQRHHSQTFLPQQHRPTSVLTSADPRGPLLLNALDLERPSSTAMSAMSSQNSSQPHNHRRSAVSRVDGPSPQHSTFSPGFSAPNRLATNTSSQQHTPFDPHRNSITNHVPKHASMTPGSSTTLCAPMSNTTAISPPPATKRMTSAGVQCFNPSSLLQHHKSVEYYSLDPGVGSHACNSVTNASNPPQPSSVKNTMKRVGSSQLLTADIPENAVNINNSSLHHRARANTASLDDDLPGCPNDVEGKPKLNLLLSTGSTIYENEMNGDHNDDDVDVGGISGPNSPINRLTEQIPPSYLQVYPYQHGNVVFNLISPSSNAGISVFSHSSLQQRPPPAPPPSEANVLSQNGDKKIVLGPKRPEGTCMFHCPDEMLQQKDPRYHYNNQVSYSAMTTPLKYNGNRSADFNNSSHDVNLVTFDLSNLPPSRQKNIHKQSMAPQHNHKVLTNVIFNTKTISANQIVGHNLTRQSSLSSSSSKSIQTPQNSTASSVRSPQFKPTTSFPNNPVVANNVFLNTDQLLLNNVADTMSSSSSITANEVTIKKHCTSPQTTRSRFGGESLFNQSPQQPQPDFLSHVQVIVRYQFDDDSTLTRQFIYPRKQSRAQRISASSNLSTNAIIPITSQSGHANTTNNSPESNHMELDPSLINNSANASILSPSTHSADAGEYYVPITNTKTTGSTLSNLKENFTTFIRKTKVSLFEPKSTAASTPASKPIRAPKLTNIVQFIGADDVQNPLRQPNQPPQPHSTILSPNPNPEFNDSAHTSSAVSPAVTLSHMQLPPPNSAATDFDEDMHISEYIDDNSACKRPTHSQTPSLIPQSSSVNIRQNHGGTNHFMLSLNLPKSSNSPEDDESGQYIDSHLTCSSSNIPQMSSEALITDNPNNHIDPSNAESCQCNQPKNPLSDRVSLSHIPNSQPDRDCSQPDDSFQSQLLLLKTQDLPRQPSNEKNQQGSGDQIPSVTAYMPEDTMISPLNSGENILAKEEHP